MARRRYSSSKQDYAETVMAMRGPVENASSIMSASAGQECRASTSRWTMTNSSRRATPPVFRSGPKPDDVAFLIYTSGTTGRPKGVMLSQGGQVASGGNSLAPTSAISSSDRLLIMMPLFHIGREDHPARPALAARYRSSSRKDSQAEERSSPASSVRRSRLPIWPPR